MRAGQVGWKSMLMTPESVVKEYSGQVGFLMVKQQMRPLVYFRNS